MALLGGILLTFCLFPLSAIAQDELGYIDLLTKRMEAVGPCTAVILDDNDFFTAGDFARIYSVPNVAVVRTVSDGGRVPPENRCKRVLTVGTIEAPTKIGMDMEKLVADVAAGTKDYVYVSKGGLPGGGVDHTGHEPSKLIQWDGDEGRFVETTACPKDMAKIIGPDGTISCKWVGDGSVLKVAVPPPLPPFTYANSKAGAEMAFIDAIAGKLGFEWAVKPETKWFSPKGNSSVDSVRDGAAHIAVGILLHRWPIKASGGVAFSATVQQSQFNMCTRKPRLLEPFFNVVKPFSWEVWIGIIVSLVVVMIFTLLIFRSVKEPLAVFGMLFQQAYREKADARGRKARPTSFSFLLLAWIAFSAVFVYSFESNLRAYLMTVDREREVNNEKDLWETGGKMYLLRGTANTNFYIHPDHGGYRRLIAQEAVDNDQFYRMTSEGVPKWVLDKIKDEGGTYFLQPEVVKYSFTRYAAIYGYNPFRVAKEATIGIYSSFVLAKRRRHFNALADGVILRLVDAGVLRNRLNHYMPPRFSDNIVEKVSRFTSPSPFDVRHFIAGFIFLGAGVVLAAMSFLCEKLIGLRKAARIEI